MFNSKLWKALSISAPLISIILLSALAGTITKPVKAQAITLHAVLSTDPYYGWQMGYHDIMKAIQIELAKIGINLELHYYDSATIYDICYFSGWDQPGPPPTGWDVTTGEQWMFAHGLMWEYYKSNPDLVPPGGLEIYPWLNERAYKLWRLQDKEFDPVKRKEMLWKYQELLMHDLPGVNMFDHYTHAITANYFYGFESPGVWWNDHHNWRLDNASALRPGVLTHGAQTEIYAGTSPIFLVTYTQEFATAATHDNLYRVTRIPYPPEEAYVNGSAFTEEGLTTIWPYDYEPELAADYPTYSADKTSLTIPIRDDVYWVWPYNDTNSAIWATTDQRYYKLDAYDVEWTLNTVLDPATGSIGYADLAPVIKSVTAPNATHVQIDLYEPNVDILMILADIWGSPILPKRLLEDIPVGSLRSHRTNQHFKYLPGAGPFVFKEWVPGDHVTFVKNPYYWGKRSDPYYPPYNENLGTIDELIIKILPDPAARMLAIKALDVELSEVPVTALSEFEAMKGAPWNATHRVYLSPRFATNALQFNLNNPILANRYVRMAIAHAIPYPDIVGATPYDVPLGEGFKGGILEGWGSIGVYPKTVGLFPWHYYGGEHLYHETLEPFEYNLTKAREYMWMYGNQTGNTEEYGPQGDADQSGSVDLDDWWIWMKNRESTGAINWPKDLLEAGNVPAAFDNWPYTIDPDWDNDNNVDVIDVGIWSTKYGTRYPAKWGR